MVDGIAAGCVCVLVGKKKKPRKNKNAASSNSSSRSTQAQTAVRFNNAELVGQLTKLETFSLDTGLLLAYIIIVFLDVEGVCYFVAVFMTNCY